MKEYALYVVWYIWLDSFFIVLPIPTGFNPPAAGPGPQGADVTAQDQEKVETYFPFFLLGFFKLFFPGRGGSLLTNG